MALDAAPFAAGTLAALAVAVLNQRANRGAAAILGQAIGRTGAIAITGDYDDKDAKFEQELAPRLNAVGRWPARVGWVSAALFAIGTVITGTDHPPVDRSNAARCEALQGDMLSAQPLRRDSPELFRALGCKPQGDGSVHAHLSAERILGLQED